MANTNMIKIQLTSHLYKKLSSAVYNKLTELNSNVNNHHMLLTIAGADQNGIIEALKKMSSDSFDVSRLSTLLYALEVSFGEYKDESSMTTISSSIKLEDAAMLRQFIVEQVAEQSQRANDYIFKLQSFVQLGQPVAKVTSLEAIDEIQSANVLMNQYLVILNNIETELKKYAEGLDPKKLQSVK